MKISFSLGTMSFVGRLVFVLAVTLLFTGVISMSIQVPVGEAAAVTPTVANGSGAEILEKEDTFEKHNFKPNELEVNSNEADSTEGDDSWENIGAIIPNPEDLDSPQDNRTEGVNKEQGTTLWGSLSTSKPSVTEEENLKMTEDEEEDPLALLSLLVKRAVEEDYGAGESETILDEDNFSFSDLPKIFEPLIKAFSGSPTSEPPSPEDFFSWFPSLKELLDPPREEPASVTSSPRNSITQPARRSALPTLLEPSLQMAPATPSAQPNEAEPLSSSLEESVTSIIPTLPTPPRMSEPSLSDVSDSEERFD